MAGQRGSATKNPQTHMDETTITHRGLEEALQEKYETQEEATRYNAAKRTIKKIVVDELQLEAGTRENPKRYRVGEFSIVLAHISGDEMTIPKWDSVSIGFADTDPSD